MKLKDLLKVLDTNKAVVLREQEVNCIYPTELCVCDVISPTLDYYKDRDVIRVSILDDCGNFIVLLAK